MCGIANSLFGVEVACVAWRFKQFERERTKRRSRENERRSREEAAPYRGFPAFLAPSNCLKTAKLRRLVWKSLVGLCRVRRNLKTPLNFCG